MEIITYVREGAITHKDNMGNEGRTEAGDVQIMSAGTGVVHAEYNLEPATTKIFQIWIMPDRRGAKPNWGAKSFPKAAREAGFEVLASGRPADAGNGALPLNVNGAVMAATLKAGQTLVQPLARRPRRLSGAGQGRGHGERPDARASATARASWTSRRSPSPRRRMRSWCWSRSRRSNAAPAAPVRYGSSR